MNQLQVPGQFGILLAIIGVLFGFFVSIYWMWIGYRAMRAHERIAESLEAPAGGPLRQL
jgi:hypothetical protein